MQRGTMMNLEHWGWYSIAGQAANSPVLIASAREYRVHLFTSGIVFTVLLAQWFDFPLDRIAALVVVAIGKIGWDLLSDGMQGRGPTYVFRDAGVDMVPTMAGTLVEALATLTHQRARQTSVANVRSQDHS